MNTSNCNHVWCTHRNILDQMHTVDNLKFYIYHPNFPHKCDQGHFDSSLGNQTQDHENCPHHQPNCTEYKAPPSDITDSTPVEIYTTTDGDQYFLKNFDSRSSFTDNEMLYHRSHEVDALTSPSIPKIIRPSEDVSKWDIQNTAEVMDWTNYHRLDVIHNFMDKLESDYPSICSTFVIGKSLEGRDLKMLKISNSNTRNKPVWMDAGIHAREWIAPATATYIANNIASNFESLPEYMTNKDWYFLPVFNPDGYEYSHTTDRMWRKNRAMHFRECVGVDLNRNFSHGWGLKGSSDNPKNNFFRGPRAFSEPESCAVRDAIINSGVSFNVYITLHSYGQIILFPFAYQAELCPNYIRLLEGATVMSKFMKYNPIAINIWNEDSNTMEIMVEGSRSAQVAGMLHEREIPYSVAVSDLSFLLEREKGSILSKCLRRSNTPKVMDWMNYHRLDVIYTFLDNLAADYPYICTVSVIGRSVEGRDIKMLKVSNGHTNNPGVWMDGAIHPREWITTAVVTYFAEQLVRNYNKMPKSVINNDWYIVPVLNPDGYEYTHVADRMWRKNRAPYGECVGVDLNRNFSYGWGEKGEEGSSEDPGNIFYRGPKPFSEPETAAVQRVITHETSKFNVFLSFHSYAEMIIFPWGYTADPCPDYVDLLEGGTAIAKAIFNANGHTYKVGSTKDLMYYAAGTSTDWAYAVANIPYCYMLELRGKKYRFLLPKEDIIVTASEVMDGLLALMEFVDKRSKSSQSG